MPWLLLLSWDRSLLDQRSELLNALPGRPSNIQCPCAPFSGGVVPHTRLTTHRRWPFWGHMMGTSTWELQPSQKGMQELCHQGQRWSRRGASGAQSRGQLCPSIPSTVECWSVWEVRIYTQPSSLGIHKMSKEEERMHVYFTLCNSLLACLCKLSFVPRLRRYRGNGRWACWKSTLMCFPPCYAKSRN